MLVVVVVKQEHLSSTSSLSQWSLRRMSACLIAIFNSCAFSRCSLLLSSDKKMPRKLSIIGILEEIDSFYWPKMHLNEKVQKIFGHLPTNLIWTNPKEQQFFLGRPFLSDTWLGKKNRWERKKIVKFIYSFHSSFWKSFVPQPLQLFSWDLFSACKPFSSFTSNRGFANFENEISNVFFVMSNLDLGKHVDSNSILVSESHLNGKGKSLKH